MSTATGYDRPSLLERLTSSTGFTVLFGIAATLCAPVVLLGVTLLPAVVSSRPIPGLGERFAILLPYGGLIGYVGLWRAYRAATSKTDYWTTLICLGAGIATAATLVAGLVAMHVGIGVGSAAITVLSLLILAALGRVARLRRLRAAEEGRVRDSLPLIFLAIALAEAACALAIGVQLAVAG